MKLRTAFVVGALLLSSAGLAQQDGGVLKVGTVAEPTSLNPIIRNDVPSSLMYMQIHDALVTYDENLNIIPALATDWELSNGNRTYTFNLRDDVVFHNGDDFTAHDVVYAFQQAAIPANQSQWLGRFSMVEDIAATDEYTVELTLDSANAAFLDQITHFGIPSMAAHEELGADGYGIAPVGTGPFKFVSWQRNDKLVVERNEDYWLTRPHLDGVEFRAIPERAVAAVELEVGGIDVAMNLNADDVLRLESSPNINIGSVPTLSYYYIGLNLSEGPTSDVRVRKAMQHAIPMDQLVDAIFGGVGAVRAYTPFAPGNLAYDETLIADFPEYDLERARELLAEAGYADGFSTTLYTPPDSNRRQLAELVQAALGQVNINVEVQALELGSMQPLYWGAIAPMWLVGWASGTDPHNYIYDMFHSDHDAWADDSVTFNTARVDVPEIDAALDHAMTLSDTDERVAIYQDVMRTVFLDIVPHIAGYHMSFNLATRDDVQDVFIDPQSRMQIVTPYNNIWLDR